ncbi:MAG: MBL fold metallo-hydrolase, partial [Deltaproteobacteria bacterium]|nr:MBL fold metallo-hydrolase [Deltaproteobacteria bacterium]
MRYVRIPVGAFATNCVILEDETSHEGIVIDPGADADVLRERVRKLGMTVKR